MHIKVLVGISGGVDSAVVASGLKKQGYEVEGCVLVMHEHCDLESARQVADEIGIKLHEVDARDAFERIVKENFANEYLAGRTPNPCILCNEKVKFKALYDFAIENGFDKIATGHYASVVCENGRYAVKRSTNTAKDQSYMLYRLPQSILEKLILPLYDFDKSEVRSLAEDENISVFGKKDSQEICFLPDGHYTEYIESVKGVCPEGNFVDSEGKILGKHKGIIHYTVGQRKGLGISLGARVFVTEISPQTNEIKLEYSMNGRKEIMISDVVYSGIDAPVSAKVLISLPVKLRYSASLILAQCELFCDGTALIKFENPVIAAPGQSAVAYIDDKVAFGGYINN